MAPLARAVAAALVVGVALVACARGSSRSATPVVPPTAAETDVPTTLTRPTVVPSNLPSCDYPAHVARPAWLPVDLPFPVGTYTYQSLPDSAGYHRALLIIPSTLDELTAFVRDQWPKAGWVLGEGDAEEGEAEQQFMKGSAAGAFKAVSEYCAPGFSRMLLVFTERSSILPGLPSSSG